MHSHSFFYTPNHLHSPYLSACQNLHALFIQVVTPVTGASECDDPWWNCITSSSRPPWLHPDYTLITPWLWLCLCYRSRVLIHNHIHMSCNQIIELIQPCYIYEKTPVVVISTSALWCGLNTTSVLVSIRSLQIYIHQHICPSSWSLQNHQASGRCLYDFWMPLSNSNQPEQD